MYSNKQEELLNTFRGLIDIYKLDPKVDPEKYEIQSPAALDVEHNEEGESVCIGIYDGKSSLCFTRITNDLSRRICQLSLICHNGVGDLECLRSWGVPVKDKQLCWDTMLIAHIVDSSQKGFGLKTLAERILNISYPSYDDIVGKKTVKQKAERVTLDKQPLELVVMYNALDCFVTYKLYKKQTYGRLEKPDIVNKVLTQSPCEAYFNELEKPIAGILHQMSNRGVCVDLTYLRTLKEDLEQQRLPIETEILNELGSINLNSPKQLLGALNAKGIKPILKGKGSTDKRALGALCHVPVVQNLIEYSEIDTLLSSFVTPYLKRGQECVHPFFKQTGTRTGRLSCSNPNLLQIPRKTENGKLVRRMFVPRPGMQFGDCDFGQIEPRVLAHLSKDPVLCQMFNDGVDFHTFTAERLSIDRDRAKVLNLSVGYRATFKSVSQQLRCSNEEAQLQIDQWWNLFPTLRRWQETLIYDSKRSGFCSTLRGRRIRIDGLTESNKWKQEAAERQLINNITQGSAVEIMKQAMINIANDKFGFQFHSGFGLLVQVYDELLFESPLAESDIKGVKECMEESLKLEVPLTVDAHVGDNWANCK